MALSEKDVRGIAEYAKIALTDDELVQMRSEEHTSELQSLTNLVCRLLLEKNFFFFF